jgi:EmrB/QacA subfamily drug resistance transporter
VLGSSAVFLDSTVVNVALPRIGRELPVHLVGVLEGQSYVYTGYLLTLSALLIPAGALGDHHGRRRVFQIGLVAFGITSALCGLAPNMEVLIVSRILQGAAGALLVPGSLALIRSSFEGEAQGRAIGIWSSASAATTLLGPFVGGLLVDLVSWRLAFLINLPLVLVAAFAVRSAPDARAPAGPLDWIGAALAGLAVGGLSFGVIFGQQHEWRAWQAYAALFAGALATVALPFWLARTPGPLVPLELFRSRNFRVVNVSTLLIYGALYVLSYYQALFLQGVLGYTATAAGLTGIPISICLIFLSTRFGALAGRLGPRLFMTMGPLLMAVGVLWLTRIPRSSPPWRLMLGAPDTYAPSSGYLFDVLPAMVLFGLGISALVAPLTTALMNSVPEANAGVGSALNNAVSRVGPQLAGAAIFVAVSAVFYSEVGERLRGSISPLNPPPRGTPAAVVKAAGQASTDAFHLAMAICILLLVAGAVVNWLGIRNRATT